MGQNQQASIPHLIDCNFCGPLEQDEALLQQAAVPHFWGYQMGLVAIGLLHNAPDIAGVQDLVEVQPPDVVCQPPLKHLLMHPGVTVLHLKM